MYPTTCTTAVGVFHTRDKADAAVADLRDSGFAESEIGMIARNADGQMVEAKDETGEAGEGAAIGAAAGAGVGALIGWGVLAGTIPVIGPALFAGTMGILASNALGGAAVVGVVGALTGWGIPAEHAKHYESEVANGRVIITVTSSGRCDEARAILRSHGATSKDPAFRPVASM
jgi:hypothetical protein